MLHTEAGIKSAVKKIHEEHPGSVGAIARRIAKKELINQLVEAGWRPWQAADRVKEASRAVTREIAGESRL